MANIIKNSNNIQNVICKISFKTEFSLIFIKTIMVFLGLII